MSISNLKFFAINLFILSIKNQPLYKRTKKSFNIPTAFTLKQIYSDDIINIRIIFFYNGDFMKRIISLILSLIFIVSINTTTIHGSESSGVYEYFVDANGILITGYNGTATTVTVPAYINGQKVVGLGSHVFYNCNITSVKLPEGLISVGNWALYSSKIKSVYVPKSLCSFHPSSFYSSVVTLYGSRSSGAYDFAKTQGIKYVPNDVIAITAEPVKSVYIENDSFNKSDVKVTVYYEKDIVDTTQDFTVSGFSSKAGSRQITISVHGFSASYEITVIPKELIGISATRQTGLYKEGETLKPDLQVRAKYNNGKGLYVTDYTIDGFDTTSTGTKTVTVTYQGFTDTFTIQVDQDWNSGTITEKSTCTESGNRHFTCLYCQETKDEPIEPLNHNFESTFTVDEEATCDEDGLKSKHCTRCNEKTELTSVSATGHSYSSVITTPPTCTTEGVITNTCKICNYSYTTAMPTQHSYNQQNMTHIPNTPVIAVPATQ